MPRFFPNSTIVCVASGPSLTQDDCDFVRGKAPVIAVNDGVRLAPWADVLFSADRNWWTKVQGMPSFSGMKYSIGENIGTHESLKYPDVTVLTYTGKDGIETEPSGLRSIKNSGGAAVNLAVHLGAVRVVLLGYDMGLYNGRAHFYETQRPSILNHSPYDTFLKMFQTTVEPLKALGVDVVNCSRHSELTCFPRGTLAEVFARAEVAA